MSDTEDGKHFNVGTHDIDIIVHGFPGKSVCHGSLGFSTIAILRHGDRTALVDVGSFGQRSLIVEQLEARGLTPADITDVLLTHSHYDHALNWVMFPNAKIAIARSELDWAVNVPWGLTPVPELYVRELRESDQLEMLDDGSEVLDGVTAHLAPGHTPGCLVFVVHGEERDIIFTGDACKNRAELLSKSADMTFDISVSRASIESIWDLWLARPNSILVPGHDLPMVHEDGAPRYLGEREAAIRAWYGESLDETTILSLLP